MAKMDTFIKKKFHVADFFKQKKKFYTEIVTENNQILQKTISPRVIMLIVFFVPLSSTLYRYCDETCFC
jgi:hypothetical protein